MRNITLPEQWYKVSDYDLRKLGVLSLVLRMGGLARLLKVYRPDFNWEEMNFIGTRHFGKKVLGASLRKLWSSHQVVQDFALREGTFISFCLPSLGLAFDYVEASSYNPQSNEVGTTLLTLHEDMDKVRLATEHGLSLLFIPFWWDRNIDSLVASILVWKPSLEETFDSFDWNESEGIPLTKTLEAVWWTNK